MSIGDFVKVGFGSTVHGIAPDNVPIYELEKDASGTVRKDINDCAFARPIAGVKGGSAGRIAGPGIKVLRSYVERMSDSTKPLGGSDFVMLIPVFFDYYQQTAYVRQELVQIIHGQLT